MLHYRILLLAFWLLPALVVAQTQSAVVLGELPDEAAESSGLLYWEGHYITHNDSGHEAVLLVLDTTDLSVARRVVLENATNVDWEDLAQDKDYIYVGDIGNNTGARETLIVYRVAKAAMANSDRVSADAIEYRYGDRDNVVVEPESDWDAEALVAMEDELLVFTKQWNALGTVAYAFPKTPGAHTALAVDTYAIGGLVTAATVAPDYSTLYLLGYSSLLQPFMIDFELSGNRDLFTAPGEKQGMGIGTAQVEGMGFRDPDELLISSESYSNSFFTTKARLFSFVLDKEDSTPDPDPDIDVGDAPPNQLLLFSEWRSNKLGYHLEVEKPLSRWAIHDLSGREVLQRQNIPGTSYVDVSHLSPNLYFFTIYVEGVKYTKRFYVYD